MSMKVAIEHKPLPARICNFWTAGFVIPQYTNRRIYNPVNTTKKAKRGHVLLLIRNKNPDNMRRLEWKSRLKCLLMNDQIISGGQKPL